MDTSTHQNNSQGSGFSEPDFPHIPKLTAVRLLGGILCHICRQTFDNKKEYDVHYKNHNNGNAAIVYTCLMCYKEISRYSTFTDHCCKHVNQDKFKCAHCPKSFSKACFMKDHINTVHKIKCTIPKCNKKFRTLKELHVHQILHKNEETSPPYVCQTCYQVIESLDMCEIHIDQHCELAYSCPICNENITKKNAIAHLTEHFGNEDIPEIQEIPDNASGISENSSVDVVGGIFCSICVKQYENRMEFDAHFPLDHAGKNIVYACNICEREFEKYSLLGLHCHEHIAKNRFQCDVCDRCFPRLSLLVIHTEAYHCENANEKPFKCIKCKRAFKGEWRLREHLKFVHALENGLNCTEPGCDEKFNTPKDLIRHQKQHRPPADNWCRQCGLQFKSITACFKHLDIHKKKRYKCPICTTGYAEKYLIMKHISQHFESVFHMCKVCGKIYNAKNRLVEHARTHSSVKPYVCTTCGKGFVKSNHLQQHLTLHTGVKPYQCVACPKTFASYPNWSKHMRKMHKIDSKTVKKPVVGAAVENAVNSSKNTNVNNETVVQDVPINGKAFVFVESDQSTMDSDSIDSAVVKKEWSILDSNLDLMRHELAVETCGLPESMTTFFEVAGSPKPSPMQCSGPSVSPTSLELPGCGLDATQDVARPVEVPHPEWLPPSGPDLIDAGILTPCGEFIDLDDHLLPHIDPRLTVNARPNDNKTDRQNIQDYQYDNYNQNIVQTIDNNSKWEPVITKIYSNYYDNIEDISGNMMSVINTDIF